MDTQSMGLVWIVVKDFKKAVKFYTETVGLKLHECIEGDYQWAELQGHAGGCRLGICQEQDDLRAGQNAYTTFTVENLDKALEKMKAKGATFIGEVQEIPGHVKMQMVVDGDGNHFQMVEKLGG